MAVGFTVLANVLLLATLVYSEWLTLETRLIGYGALTVVWLLARWQSRAERRAAHFAEATNFAEIDGELAEDAATERKVDRLAAERDRMFREAQGHYLSNDWVSTEQVLLKLLKQDARDVESRLMLATLWRHQGRLAEAARQLDRLQRLEAAEKWQYEVAAERMAIYEANDSQATDNTANDSQATDNTATDNTATDNEATDNEVSNHEPDNDQENRSNIPSERTEPEETDDDHESPDELNRAA